MFLAAYALHLWKHVFQRATTDDVLEVTACRLNDMEDGEMREVQLEGNSKALLVRDEGRYHAVSSKCTHYGSPLVKGVYCRGVVRCPWHGACFNIASGDLEDFPGLDSLHKYEVKEEGEKVKIFFRRSQLKTFRRRLKMCGADATNIDRVLIIGGGPASVSCAETLRQQNFRGSVTICTRENHLPYDRPKLSKAMTASPQQILLRKAEFYQQHDIAIKLNKEAVSVDCSKREVRFADGFVEQYTHLLLATGGSPRVPRNVPAEYVMRLRSPDDATAIVATTAGKDVIVAGTSFVGMELASSLYTKAKSLTIIGRHDAPFYRFLGDKVGPIILKMFLKKGMYFCPNDEICEVETADSRLVSVRLKSGKKLPADVIIAGVGVEPATHFLAGSGIEMNSQGFVVVDKAMRTNSCDVYAAGDITEFPLYLEEGRLCNVQHWPLAHMQGRIAALSILGQDIEIHTVPFFWSVVLGKSITYCGYGPKYDDVIVHEVPGEEKFAAFYIKGERVVSIASMGMGAIVSQVAEVMKSGQIITKSEVIDSPYGWRHKLGVWRRSETCSHLSI